MDFKTAINNIRHAIYGIDVRESLAVMGEYLEEYFHECASKIGDAIQSAKDAAQSATEAKQALTDTKNAKTDAVDAITTAKSDALTSVSNATTAADTAAANAKQSAETAAAHEQNAGTKADAAAGSAEAASNSAKEAEAAVNKAGAMVSTDPTLSIEGAPADAKATGDALSGKLESTSNGYVKALDISGNTLTMTYGDGTTNSVQLAESYTLPAATAETLGGVKVGANLSIDTSGLLSGLADGGEIVASGTGYIRYANGMQICWGKTTTASIAFPVPFADTNLAVTAMDQYALEYTTTTMNSVKSGRIVGNWVVIGRWK